MAAASYPRRPRAPELLQALGDDPRFKRELPAAQIELLTPSAATAGDAAVHLRAARRRGR